MHNSSAAGAEGRRERCIEVYTLPTGNEYTRVEKYESGQAIRLGAFSDVEVRVSDVMR